MRFWIRYGWVGVIIGGALLWSMIARLTRPPHVVLVASPEAMGRYYSGDRIREFDGLAEQFKLAFDATSPTAAMIEVEGLRLNDDVWCQIWVDDELVKEERHPNGQATVRCEFLVQP